MQSVLVSGGAGFIGYHLCKLLLEKIFEVYCVDNFLTGSQENIASLSKNSHFHFIEKDVTEREVCNVFEAISFSAVFHLASPASPNKKSPRSYIAYPIETLLVNSIGTQNMLEIAKKHKSKFLFTSSSEVYGDPAITPQKEDYFGNVNPNGVRSVYDEAKRFGEAITMAYVRKFNMDCRIVRIFNTYGPNMQKDDGRVVSNFINQALENKDITIYGDGMQTRSFCYVDDMVLGLTKALFIDKSKGEVINLGNPDKRTIAELATIIKDLTMSQSKIIYESLPEDDPKERKPDIKKAQSLLGWQPNMALNDGLRKTIVYFRQIRQT
ncbi:MAG: SDR family oxidoreductase [Candidatus Levyibacteriota bacterium]|nr:MAG: SDR family oxidoreductase [Candidatus Levybacteria bacterium]